MERNQDSNKVDMDIMNAAIDKVLAYGPPKSKPKTRKEPHNGTGKVKGERRRPRNGKGASHGETR